MNTDVDYIEIGKRLTFVRKDKGFSQEKMGKVAGLSRTYIGSVEVGKQHPSFDFLIKVSQAFNVSLDWLVYGRGQMHVISEDDPLNKLDAEDLRLAVYRNMLPDDIQIDLYKLEKHLLENFINKPNTHAE